MLEIAEIKINNNKHPLKHIKTLIFLVNVTLEKPPTTLGENQFESSSLFLKKENIQQKSASKLLQLISALLKNCPAETSLLLLRY